MELTHDAIVLAGGTGRRLGGVLKPQVTVRGRRLLDHVLDATAGARRVVVVAPGSVPVPDGVVRTLEEPPHGGPVAGIAAGLAALGEPAPVVLLLACDLPGAADAVPRLLAAAVDPPLLTSAAAGTSGVGEKSAVGEGEGVWAGGEKSAVGEGEGGVAGVGAGEGGRADGVVLRDGAGREQWLLGVYATAALQGRLTALAQAGRLRDGSVRELVRPLCLVSLLARAEEGRDVDTWADRDAIEQ